jgi:hypothetical protein
MDRPKNEQLREFASIRAGRELGDSLVAIIESHRDIFPNCTLCKAFVASHYWCGTYQQNVPAHVIVKGCPAFADVEDIPF